MYCNYRSLCICWWQQPTVTGVQILCDLSQVLKSLYDCPIAWYNESPCIGVIFPLASALLLLIFTFFLMNLVVTALTSLIFRCVVPCVNLLR